jgi:predicted DNA-binding transcriptional regulator AlpA
MRLLSYGQLKLKFGDGFYSRDHLRRKCNASEFPMPVAISSAGRRIGWVESEIDEWLAERASLRGGPDTGAGAA